MSTIASSHAEAWPERNGGTASVFPEVPKYLRGPMGDLYRLPFVSARTAFRQRILPPALASENQRKEVSHVLSTLRGRQNGGPEDRLSRAQHVPRATVFFLQVEIQHTRAASLLEPLKPKVAGTGPIAEGVEEASNCCPAWKVRSRKPARVRRDKLFHGFHVRSGILRGDLDAADSLEPRRIFHWRQRLLRPIVTQREERPRIL